MLCQTCKSIDFDRLLSLKEKLDDFPTKHHDSFAALLAASESGCELCGAIEKSTAVLIKQEALRNRLKSEPVYLKMNIKGRHNAGYLGCSAMWVHCLGKVIVQLEIYVPEASVLANPDLKLFSGRPISSNPASDESFALAKAWIHNCLTSQDHKFCPKLNQPHMSSLLQKSHREPGVPTRLIDVGPSDGSEEPKLIICSACRLSANWEYVALSHCWGQAQLYRIHNDDTIIDLETWMEDQKSLAEIKRKPLTTTTETLEQRLQQIPMSTLPKTFRDAITFTRGLGLRYIWIDSLCIIQNSRSDWKEEAARMADIYKNAYVTIAAESSKDSHEGMFTLDDWETCVNGTGSALRLRGWVLQESLLAPRTIRVSSQQMFWESNELGDSDTDLEDMTDQGLTARDIIYLQWSSIIRDYSHRKLSVSSDIFPALEGLAREFNTHLNDTYIAGLWKQDLLRGLLWRIEGSKPGELPLEATPYRAPSWSWASTFGGI
ncbi:HET-domain-containing protein, partial [Stipitochalara longipes BDJ]